MIFIITKRNQLFNKSRIIKQLFTTQNWTTKLRRSMLDLLLDKVILNHDSKTRLHHLGVHLRIPLLLSGNKKGASKDAPIISNYNLLNVSGDLIQDGTNHSTVVVLFPMVFISTVKILKKINTILHCRSTTILLLCGIHLIVSTNNFYLIQ
jgi:hypothetical protein